MLNDIIANLEATSPSFNAEYTAISFIEEVLSEIESQEMTRAELAEKIGITEAAMNRHFNCSPRMTLLTIHKFALALGKKVKITLED